jgi:hypothetical protein
MLEPILGSVNSERVLLYILARQQGYPREIARFFGSDPDSIQKRLAKPAAGGCSSRDRSAARFYISSTSAILFGGNC